MQLVATQSLLNFTCKTQSWATAASIVSMKLFCCWALRTFTHTKRTLCHAMPTEFDVASIDAQASSWQESFKQHRCLKKQQFNNTRKLQFEKRQPKYCQDAKSLASVMDELNLPEPLMQAWASFSMASSSCCTDFAAVMVNSGNSPHASQLWLLGVWVGWLVYVCVGVWVGWVGG